LNAATFSFRHFAPFIFADTSPPRHYYFLRHASRSIFAADAPDTSTPAPATPPPLPHISAFDFQLFRYFRIFARYPISLSSAPPGRFSRYAFHFDADFSAAISFSHAAISPPLIFSPILYAAASFRHAMPFSPGCCR
jgi:hypothetical protein